MNSYSFMLKHICEKYKVYIFLSLMTIGAHLPLNLGANFIKPQLIVITVFFFSIFAQTRPSVLFLILLGIFNDLISHSIIGIAPLNYVLISLIASSNTKALLEQRFNVVWLALLLALFIVNLAEGLILFYMQNAALFNKEVLVSIAITFLAYPALHSLYSKKLHWFRVAE